MGAAYTTFTIGSPPFSGSWFPTKANGLSYDSSIWVFVSTPFAWVKALLVVG